MVCALPLDFHWKFRILRTIMCAALHGVEASFVSQSSLAKLWSALVAAVRSRVMPLANAGSILSLLDGPDNGDPGFHVVWSRFRMIRWFLAYQPGETGRINHMSHHDSLGCVGHGPIHLLVLKSRVSLACIWIRTLMVWSFLPK